MDKSNIVRNTDEFIAGFPKDVQAILEELRATIKEAAAFSDPFRTPIPI